MKLIKNSKSLNLSVLALFTAPIWLSPQILLASEEAVTGSHNGLAKLAAAIAICIGAAGAATGQGKAASAALEGIARNPASRADVFVPMLLSLVFMELQALLCFVIAFLLATGS